MEICKESKSLYIVFPVWESLPLCYVALIHKAAEEVGAEETV